MFNACNFKNCSSFLLVIQSFDFGSPEHVVVRRESDQLLTLATGNGVFVQVSIRTKEVNQRTCNLIVQCVYVVKDAIEIQYSVCILRVCVCRLVTHHAPYYIFVCILSLPVVSFYVIAQTMFYQNPEHKI